MTYNVFGGTLSLTQSIIYVLFLSDFTSRFPARTAYAVNGLPKVSVIDMAVVTVA